MAATSDKNTDIQKAKAVAEIYANPVLWAKTFLRTVDNATKKVGPWEARWYQAEMLMDKSDKKVARCGRRTGGFRPSPTNCWNGRNRQNQQRTTIYSGRTETRRGVYIFAMFCHLAKECKRVLDVNRLERMQTP